MSNSTGSLRKTATFSTRLTYSKRKPRPSGRGLSDRLGRTTARLRPAGVVHSITQQGQKLAVGLGSARTMEAITPFPQGRLRGHRDAVAVAGKKQSSPGWPRPCGFDGRERPMARPVAHELWTGVGATHHRPEVRATPSGYPTRHTLREGPKERPQTRKLTAGGCRLGPT